MTVLQSSVGVYLGTMGFEDIRKKKLMIWELLLGALITAAGIWIQSEIRLVSRLVGLGIGLLFLGIGYLTKEAIGIGDCVMILYLGVLFGYVDCIKILSVSLFLCCLVCIGGLSFRVMKRKQRIPFLPFLFAGFLINSLCFG